ncbi:hypothetical protein RBWH47_01785 [Rhodopirellula baltica WH47]|uniref:Uncharacterized protein n=1 Tax=Rhodopirellula baltica WH47 TaxID=991778 RepID=F2AVD0_RHOBT|nr:hypothetical protein RBWH47_01785 [Rhodopirellula baltica WH47]
MLGLSSNLSPKIRSSFIESINSLRINDMTTLQTKPRPPNDNAIGRKPVNSNQVVRTLGDHFAKMPARLGKLVQGSTHRLY